METLQRMADAIKESALALPAHPHYIGRERYWEFTRAREEALDLADTIVTTYRVFGMDLAFRWHRDARANLAKAINLLTEGIAEWEAMRSVCS